ncbi:D-alanyl-D-alanine carboxypeptidase/D-alanyl-D-alanine-endopeptidase [Parahaliea sp. F7430]|uniref:D-alanyl-D-alanine carboxypeptidase/D-alanyl-D-alanine-endopeptidase n=1 Tax=Sediminihaliea albiluteola TaxID=2758564 RepID=A0A7W2TYN3_9GAMM|nr:D-alanyl-D-alanine carboxypeptidase/D-alanyl-D-alanine-endopeptidase [Sediminihaliea albiluteola]MBA6414332.1 D-alanyl-D-alanine carboxypeptidase/D-alanyl-D-alanine-endopeptidase [Sediminihaliea albiluteola]
MSKITLIYNKGFLKLRQPGLWALLLTALLASSQLSAAAQANSIPADTDPWAQEITAYAKGLLGSDQALSLAAVPLSGPGKAQFVDADKPMVPASIMKLVTTYAALELLGPNFHWNTDFLSDGELRGERLEGNLYVRFGGDPKLTIERLWRSLGELRGKGITRITGDLVLDGSHFKMITTAPPFDDKGDNPFAAFLVEPSAYLTNLNLLQFQVNADQRGVQAWVTPALPGIEIDNQVKISAGGACPSSTALKWQPEAKEKGPITLRISGQLPKGCQVSSYLSLLSQPRYSALLIRHVLASHGITVEGQDSLASSPDQATLLLRSRSPDLATMVRDINKWSSNVMARQMLLTIGAELGGEQAKDDRVAGIEAIHHWLQAKGIDSKGLVIENGSGLSRNSRMTARQGVEILQQAWNSPYASDLLASMPIIALDGTMAKRLRNTGLQGLGRIKTGSLENVRSIAGYSRDDKDTHWAIVAMVNNNPAWNGQGVLDRILYSLYHRPPTLPSSAAAKAAEPSAGAI